MNIPSPLQHLPHPTHHLWIKRDDLIHPIICGNKRRKISGYLQTYFPDTRANKTKSATDHKTTSTCRDMRWLPRLDFFGSFLHQGKNEQQYTSIMTFGGAYSNHLRAIAHTGTLYDIPTIGIVRGEELATKPLNDNLQFCHDQGMELHFIDRQTYRQIKHATRQEEIYSHIPLSPQEKERLVIPEGGCGAEGLIGTHQIIREIAAEHDAGQEAFFCIEAGTGTTAAGCIQAINELGLDRKVVIIPVLHDLPTITTNIEKHNPHTTNYSIIPGYEHSGYAKTSPQLIDFIRQRKDEHHIHIEPTYSGKLMYAIYDLIDQGYFSPDAEIIVYHSGY